MAIVDNIPGLKVEVIANDEPLAEYRDKEAEPGVKEAVQYIEAQSNGTFQIVTQFLEEFPATHGFRIEVRLDGNKVDSVLIRLKDLKKNGGHKMSGIRSKINGRWHQSNLLFATFVIDQDSNRKLDRATTERLNKAGEITVLLHRIKNMRWPRAARHMHREKADIPHRISKFGKVPEKSVQALGLSHHGDVGVPQQKSRGGTYTYENVDGKEDDHAFATFRFKYRSLDTLKAIGIVQRSLNPTPTPTPGIHEPRSLPSGRNNEGLSCEEHIAIIGTYRGHTCGLRGLAEKELIALLDHYRMADIPIRGVKRERDGDVEMGGCGQSMGAPIVID